MGRSFLEQVGRDAVEGFRDQFARWSGDPPRVPRDQADLAMAAQPSMLEQASATARQPGLAAPPPGGAAPPRDPGPPRIDPIAAESAREEADSRLNDLISEGRITVRGANPATMPEAEVAILPEISEALEAEKRDRFTVHAGPAGLEVSLAGEPRWLGHRLERALSTRYAESGYAFSFEDHGSRSTKNRLHVRVVAAASGPRTDPGATPEPQRMGRS